MLSTCGRRHDSSATTDDQRCHVPNDGRRTRHVNVIVSCDVAETHRRVLLESELLGIDGRWEAVGGVCHLIASRLLDMSELLGGLDVRSRDFH